MKVSLQGEISLDVIVDFPEFDSVSEVFRFLDQCPEVIEHLLDKSKADTKSEWNWRFGRADQRRRADVTF